MVKPETFVDAPDEDSDDLTPREQRFGDLMYARATGQSPEMECARTLCHLLEPVYRPGMRLLDAGCGAGHYLRSLRARLDRDIDYRGIDASAHYIDLARRAWPGEERFETAQVEALPFADASFDIVVCINVLPNLPAPPAKALSELVRVARRAVVVRTLFADANYLIREIDTIEADETRLINADGSVEPGGFTHNNLYTERYLRQSLASINSNLQPVIKADNHNAQFASPHPAGTRTFEGRQVAGPLLLDWRYMLIELDSD